MKLGYMISCYEKNMKPLDAEVLDSLMTQESVVRTMRQIEAEPDAEKKSQLKSTLPVILFACQMPEDGVRPTAASAVPSGLCLHDWDQMPEDPRSFYREHLAGKEAALHIVMAHVTPRGQGIRLVTELQPGQTLMQSQEELARQFGMEQYADRKIKDLSRLSFLPGKDYLLYLDAEKLFQRTVPEETAAENGSPVGTNPSGAVAQEPASAASVPSNSVAESFRYQDLKYSAIIQALLNRLVAQGLPQPGERNSGLYALVRELRHICDYNYQTIYMLVAPYFTGLPDGEIRRTIASALASSGRGITPFMQGVLHELHNQNVETGDDTDPLHLSKLPKLSEVEEMIIRHYSNLRAQVFAAMLPIWGLYGTHIRFEGLNGQESSLSFMTAVVGRSGSGKSFASHLFDQTTVRFQVQDALERDKASKYLAQCDRVGENGEKPEDPRPKVHLLSDDITTSQMLDYLNNLEGEHALQFTEEVARLAKAKRTVYGDNDDLYCKAFDNGRGGKESKSKLTRNILLKIYLNTLFCGTPGSMHKFYNNPEGGLNNRVFYAFMPEEKIKGFPKYRKFSPEEQKMFDEVADRLWKAGQDKKPTILPWLYKIVRRIKDKWDREDDENPDNVWNDLGKRALEVALRVGVLQWYLRNCPTDQKQLREIAKVVRWTAVAMRQGIYAFCGEAYEQINAVDEAYMQKQKHLTKNKQLFSLLPEIFTVQDVMTQRVKNGGSQDVRMVLSRWRASGMILQLSDGRYQKVPELVA